MPANMPGSKFVVGKKLGPKPPKADTKLESKTTKTGPAQSKGTAAEKPKIDPFPALKKLVLPQYKDAPMPAPLPNGFNYAKIAVTVVSATTNVPADNFVTTSSNIAPVIVPSVKTTIKPGLILKDAEKLMKPIDQLLERAGLPADIVAHYVTFKETMIDYLKAEKGKADFAAAFKKPAQVINIGKDVPVPGKVTVVPLKELIPEAAAGGDDDFTVVVSKKKAPDFPKKRKGRKFVQLSSKEMDKNMFQHLRQTERRKPKPKGTVIGYAVNKVAEKPVVPGSRPAVPASKTTAATSKPVVPVPATKKTVEAAKFSSFSKSSNTLQITPTNVSSQKPAAWILDSGAERHFLGVFSDYIPGTYRAFPEPRKVRGADNGLKEAYGEGAVRVGAPVNGPGQGTLLLTNVAFVPSFEKVGALCSPAMLNEAGLDIVLSGGVGTITHVKTGKLAFRTHKKVGSKQYQMGTSVVEF